MKSKIFRFKNIKTTPDKLRLAADLVRNKNLSYAYDILSLIKNKSARLLVINLKAIENSVKDWQIDNEKLTINKISVEEGVKMKRSIPRSRGRMSPFKRRMSRLNIELSTEEKREDK